VLHVLRRGDQESGAADIQGNDLAVTPAAPFQIGQGV